MDVWYIINRTHCVLHDVHATILSLQVTLFLRLQARNFCFTYSSYLRLPLKMRKMRNRKHRVFQITRLFCLIVNYECIGRLVSKNRMINFYILTTDYLIYVLLTAYYLIHPYWSVRICQHLFPGSEIIFFVRWILSPFSVYFKMFSWRPISRRWGKIELFLSKRNAPY